MLYSPLFYMKEGEKGKLGCLRLGGWSSEWSWMEMRDGKWGEANSR